MNEAKNGEGLYYGRSGIILNLKFALQINITDSEHKKKH